MSDDIVERLNEVVHKAWANGWWKGRVQRDVAEAADEIVRLRKSLKTMTEINYERADAAAKLSDEIERLRRENKRLESELSRRDS